MNYEQVLQRFGNHGVSVGDRIQVFRNTFLEHRVADSKALVVESLVLGRAPVDAIVYNPDGSVILNHGGQTTQAMKHRINSFLPDTLGWSVFATRGQWYLVGPGRVSIPFVNGMTIAADGTVGA
jgi:hypothetical protein